jgi:hypothetical protein
MAIPLKDIIDNPSLIPEVDGPKCCLCGVILLRIIEDTHYIKGKPVCGDCYYGELGNVIEK